MHNMNNVEQCDRFIAYDSVLAKFSVLINQCKETFLNICLYSQNANVHVVIILGENSVLKHSPLQTNPHLLCSLQTCWGQKLEVVRAIIVFLFFMKFF